MLSKTRCVLAVPRLDVSVPFYRDRLGMTVEFEHPGWCFLSRDRFALMLGECPEAIPPRALGDHSYFAYVTVSDARSLADEFDANGVEFIKALADEPWGMREFGVRTIDGHRILFGQALESGDVPA